MEVNIVSENTSMQKIVIVGGGFGGVRAALDLAQSPASKNMRIQLISRHPHFEYHAALYKVIAGISPLEVCIPLQEIFKGKNVELVIDTITTVDPETKCLKGGSGSTYTYDKVVLALGSETHYFNIPGLEELSYPLHSISDALRLKRHIHEMFSNVQSSDDLHFTVVGGGPAGVEVAGVLAQYGHTLAKKHAVSPSYVSVDLIEAAPHILPSASFKIRNSVEKRLRALGVTILVDRTVMKEDLDNLFLKGMEIKTKTVVWTAGVTPNRLYKNISGLSFDSKGRVLVDASLQAKGVLDVFVIGDGAALQQAGTASNALANGSLVAKVLGHKVEVLPPYIFSRSWFSVIAVGFGWAAASKDALFFSGIVGWWFRRLMDFRFFSSILPFRKAFFVWKSGYTLCESCSICSKYETNK